MQLKPLDFMRLISKPSAAILEQIPYILLVPIHNPEDSDLNLEGLQQFLKENYNVNSIATQSAWQLQIEEQDFIVAVKNIDTDYFCALKILFKSCLTDDYAKEIQIAFSLINKYKLEVFDGKTHTHLPFSRRQLREHVEEIHHETKTAFLRNLLPKYTNS